jgi:hypothetical protein
MNLAAVSYDSVETLKRFSDAYHISYPLLSDAGSTTITAFGLFNTNMPPGVFAYGVPFPGTYLLGPDGVVREKFFLPNYRLRTTGSAMVMKLTAHGVSGNAVVISEEPLQARVELSATTAFTGQQVGLQVTCSVADGWHVYGAPLPQGYTPLSLKLDDQLAAEWSIDLPAPTPLRLAALNETLPVYQGEFRCGGRVLIKSQLEPGDYKLRGTLSFQACSESICEPPRSVDWELPIAVRAMVPAPPKP